MDVKVIEELVTQLEAVVDGLIKDAPLWQRLAWVAVKNTVLSNAVIEKLFAKLTKQGVVVNAPAGWAA